MGLDGMTSEMEVDFLRVLERDEIEPHFQPIVELSTRKLVGFEVLSRWHHPTAGLIPPDEFIPFAERAGLIGLLTEKLLGKAFAAATTIPSPLTLSVNLSPTQFRERNLPLYIERAANRGGFPLHRLVLEVTEGALIHNLQLARAIAHGLKELGVRLALDDFGTGYSSLRHLQALPFDELKVDASFVRSMNHRPESRKITAAVVGLGHSLGLTTLAEGVESTAQTEMLLWLGCEYGQGWLFGRPVPADKLPELVGRGVFSIAETRPEEPIREALFNGIEALPLQRLAQLQAIYDGAPIGLMFLDTNMRYIGINRPAAELNGVSVPEHIGRRMTEASPGLFSLFEPHIRRSLRGESFRDIEVMYTPFGREERVLLLSYEPARDEADEVIGVSIAIVDDSERKRANEAIPRPQQSGLPAHKDRPAASAAVMLDPKQEIWDRQSLLDRIDALEQEVRTLRAPTSAIASAKSARRSVIQSSHR
jgi:PAS domain S-box-containing protein